MPIGVTDESQAAHGGDRRRDWVSGVVVALFLVGATMRLLGAWWYRHSTNPDYGIVALMAKHMAEGRNFPVFFYGQNYMGSFEPALSALLCRVFGCSGFVICLGTALLGILLLPVVYAWARDAGGRAAGVAALAFCVIGPEGYFHYESSPRGGYAVTLLIAALVLWGSARLGDRLRRGDPLRVLPCFLLGCLAGLGLWSNLLIVPALVAGAMIVTLTARLRLMNPRVLAVLPGVLLGGLPLWIWNARNGWHSLSVARSFGSFTDRFISGQKLFWVVRSAALLDLQETALPWRVGATLLYVLFFVTAVGALFLRTGPQTSRRRITIACVLIFFGVFSVVFSLSSFALFRTARYLLPLVPAIAVLAGVATATLMRFVPSWAAWLPLVVLVGWQAHILPNHIRRAGKYAMYREYSLKLQRFLDEKDLRAVYSPYLLHGLNFFLDETFYFGDVKGERYGPIARKVELADRVSVLNNYGGAKEFVRMTGGTARRESLGPFSVLYELHPPPEITVPLNADSWRSARGADGLSVREALSDMDLDTTVSSRLPADRPEWIEIEFSEQQSACGIRMLVRGGKYPVGWQVEGRPTASSEWRTLAGPQPFTHFFWSGPRPYWGGMHFRMEARFDAQPLEAVRVRLQKDGRHRAFLVSELQVLTCGEGDRDVEARLPDLVDLLESRKIREVYADRWVANRVWAETGARIRTSCEPWTFESEPGPLPATVRFSPASAIVVPTSGAAGTRECLRRRDVAMRETQSGPWTVFDFDESLWRSRYADVPGIVHCGFTCMLGNRKQWAAYLTEQGRQFLADAMADDAINAFRRAADALPGYKPALTHLAETLRTAGRLKEAERYERVLRTAFRPQVPAVIDFAQGIRFLGIEIEPERSEPGGRLAVRYFWECPPEVETDTLAVFVHFIGPGGRFQDDHVLLEDMDTGFQPFPEVFVEHREMVLPEDLAPGRYDVRIGLVSRASPGRRLRADTDLPQRRSAVLLPVQVAIGGSSGRGGTPETEKADG